MESSTLAPRVTSTIATPAHSFRQSLVVRGLCALGLLALLVWGWNEILKPRLIAKRWGVVEPGQIYRSGQVSRHLLGKMLDQNKIRVIVDLTTLEPGNIDQVTEDAEAQRRGITKIRCPLQGDGTGEIREYARALAAIVAAEKSQQPVLVHCAAGSQRTGGVVAMYRLLFQQADPQAVRDEMVRFDWSPTRDRKLLDYLDQHQSELARLLVEEGVLSQVPDPLPRLPRP